MDNISKEELARFQHTASVISNTFISRENHISREDVYQEVLEELIQLKYDEIPDRLLVTVARNKARRVINFQSTKEGRERWTISRADLVPTVSSTITTEEGEYDIESITPSPDNSIRQYDLCEFIDSLDLSEEDKYLAAIFIEEGRHVDGTVNTIVSACYGGNTVAARKASSRKHKLLKEAITERYEECYS